MKKNYFRMHNEELYKSLAALQFEHQKLIKETDEYDRLLADLTFPGRDLETIIEELRAIRVRVHRVDTLILYYRTIEMLQSDHLEKMNN
jgi:hypothetical protein